MDPAVRQRVEQACEQGGTSIHATGSSPGFSTTTMPLTLVYPMRRTDEGYSEHLAGYTANPAVNSIPNVVEAEPGIRTIFDLPPVVARLG